MTKIRLSCFSDMHGTLSFKIPDCDIALCAGDIAPSYHPSINTVLQENFFNNIFEPWLFKPWLLKQSYTNFRFTPGNHDIICEKDFDKLCPSINSACIIGKTEVIQGLKIHFMPWQTPYGCGWVFNASDEERKLYASQIPEDTDIIVSHGPPYGLGDFSNDGQVHTGCPFLRNRIELIAPRLVITGHIHEGYSATPYKCNNGKTEVYNVSLLNTRYEMVNPVTIIDLEV